jgi:hypothetical protein
MQLVMNSPSALVSVPGRVLTLGAVVLAGTLALAGGCSKDQLSGPKAEVKENTEKVDLPPVPAESAFAFPKHDDGSKSVKELRVRLPKYDGQTLSVRGYIVKTYSWAVDCAPTIKKEPGWTEVEVMAAINANPDQCQRIKFFLGDSKDTPEAQSLWVVDVPRAPTPMELKNLPKEELADKNLWKELIPYDVGDEVVVTGVFGTSSPHGENNERGLITYATMKNITKGVESQPLPPPGAEMATKAPPPGAR